MTGETRSLALDPDMVRSKSGVRWIGLEEKPIGEEGIWMGKRAVMRNVRNRYLGR